MTDYYLLKNINIQFFKKQKRIFFVNSQTKTNQDIDQLLVIKFSLNTTSFVALRL